MQQIQHICSILGGCALIIREWELTRLDFNIYFLNILYSLVDVFTVFSSKILPQITVMQLFLAQQNVQKAKLAKCVSTLCPSCLYRISVQDIILDVILAWLVRLSGVGTCFCACVHVQSDSRVHGR